MCMDGICIHSERTATGRVIRTCAGRTPLRRLLGVVSLAVLAIPATIGAQQKPNSGQTPGSGAQVRTGTSSGLDTDIRLMNMLADHQFIQLEQEVGKLPPWQEQYYRGILANRDNNSVKSIELLEPLVSQVTASGNVAREKLLRKALAEDYLRLGNWAKAAEAYETLEARLGSKLSSDEQDELELPVKMTPLVRNHPPMTVDPFPPFMVTITKNPLGLNDIPVFVDSRPQNWILDPTMPFNLISRSHAKEAGLKISDESVVVNTLRGRQIKLHPTVIPRFTIGGQMTLHNVTAFVFDDKDYYFPQTRYQVEGALGYPAVEAMGSVTIADSGRIYVDQSAQTASKIGGSVRFFLDGDQVILALGGSESFGASRGGERMYAIDAGGQQTYLTSRYYDEHTNDFADQKMELFTLKGMPNMAPVSSYSAETLPITVAKTTIQFHFIPVLTQIIGAAAVDDVYGVLGVDALDQLGSYTFNYKTMQFSIRLSEARD